MIRQLNAVQISQVSGGRISVATFALAFLGGTVGAFLDLTRPNRVKEFKVVEGDKYRFNGRSLWSMALSTLGALIGYAISE